MRVVVVVRIPCVPWRRCGNVPMLIVRGAGNYENGIDEPFFPL